LRGGAVVVISDLNSDASNVQRAHQPAQENIKPLTKSLALANADFGRGLPLTQNRTPSIENKLHLQSTACAVFF